MLDVFEAVGAFLEACSLLRTARVLRDELRELDRKARHEALETQVLSSSE